MTIILLTAVITVILSYIWYKPIHQYNLYLYGVFFIIALLLREDANLVSLGYVPFGVFVVVMYAGVLDKGTLRKRLFMVRAELAIIGTILLIPHSFGYLEYFLDDVGFLKANASFYIGFFCVLLLIPLAITSFQYIRRKMKYIDWKRLHQLAYLFYLSIGLHLILIGNSRQWLYIILFGFYFGIKGVMKLEEYWTNRSKIKKTSLD